MNNFSPNVKQIKRLLISGIFKNKLHILDTEIINNRTFIFILSKKKKKSFGFPASKKRCNSNKFTSQLYFVYTFNHCLIAIREGSTAGDKVWLLDSLGSLNTEINYIKCDLEKKFKIKVYLKRIYPYQHIYSDICWSYVILFIFCYVIERKALFKVIYELRNSNPFSVYNKVLSICTRTTHNYLY